MLSGMGAGHTGGRWGRRRPSTVHVAAYERRWPRSGLSGAVGPEGIALWESQLGATTLVHVEPPAIAARMRGTMRRFGVRPGSRVGPSMARKLGRRACKCHAASAGLSGAVSPEQRELWSWNAYYPSDPNRIPLPAPTPSGPYRSGDAPGFSGGKPIVISAPVGTLSGGLGYVGNLGFGFLKKIGKAVGGVVKTAANVVTKIPGVNLVAKMIPGASLALDAAKMVGGMLSPDKPSGGGGGGAAPVAASAPQALTAGGAPASPYAPPGGGGAAPVRIPTNIAQRGDIDALRQEVRANAGFATKSDVAALKDAVNAKQSAKQQAAQKAAVAKAVKSCQSQAKKAQKAAIAKARTKDAAKAKKRADKAAKKLAKLAKTLKKLRAKPCPELGQKYPAGARQRFDPKSNKYVVYAPKKAAGVVSGGLSGFQAESALGLFKPTITFTLNGLGAATAQQAQAAINAVQAFAVKAKQPPQIAIAAVAAFQKADGLLKPDGLWGPNAQAAAAFYTGRPVSQLPAVAKPYAKSKVTWKPPAAVIAKAPPAVKPAPKPVKASKPKASKPAPKPAPKPKAVKVKAAPKPAAATYGPPDVTSKPSLLPVTGGTIAPIPPVAAYEPEAGGRGGNLIMPVEGSGAPAPLPSAPAGMKTVGTEDSNPGLPPVGAPSAPSSGIVLNVSGPRRKKGRKYPPPAFPAPPLPGQPGSGSRPFDDDDGGGVPHWLWVLGALWALDTSAGRRRVA